MRMWHALGRFVAVLGAAAVMGAALPGAPAQAASSTICSGFSSCAAKLKSDAGYGLVYARSFWNMRPGHNCTNYVAYRLTNGRTTARPPGTGDAGSWAAAARAYKIPVTSTPSVGAVAWWSGDAVAAKYSGHVAYVERVYSNGSIDISEDNLDGTFRWRRLSPGTGWPSAFIHYPKSDGSPLGTFTSVTADTPGQIDFRGISSDPDGGLLAPTYLVTLGGPRDAAGIESFTFSTPYFSFHRIKSVKRRGPTTMYLYALNTLLTRGHDVLLGTKPVTIRDASGVQAALADTTITTATVPRMTVALPPTAAVGSVDVKRGTTLLKTVTFAAGGSRSQVLDLPKQAAGAYTLTASYRGSAYHLPSTAKVALTVR
jgi:surface antigen